MASPLNALVSSVLNNVRTGLHGKADISISPEQIVTELLQIRAKLVTDGEIKGIKLANSSHTQELPLVPIKEVDPRADWRTGQLDQRLADLGLPVGKLVRVAPLPRLLTDSKGLPIVDFIGSLEQDCELKVVYGRQGKYARHDKLTGRRATITLQENVGQLSECCPAWPFLLARVALFDPRESSAFGKLFDPDVTPGPWADAVEEAMVRTLTNKYVSEYGRYQKTSDTGVDSPL